MFTAIGSSVKRNGANYDVAVDYFDDRVTPNKRVASITHTVATPLELTQAVAAKLTEMKAADQVGKFTTAVIGKELGSI